MRAIPPGLTRPALAAAALAALWGPPPAAAQPPPPLPSVRDGMPDGCPGGPPWAPQPGDPDFASAAVCVLVVPACPASPLFPGRWMRPGAPPGDMAARAPGLDGLYPDALGYPQEPGLARHPEFCEERVLRTDGAVFDACLNLAGHAVATFDAGGGETGCRLLRPAECPAGTHRAGSATCRAVRRRAWTCPAGYSPRNEFNGCYRLPARSGVGAHPACGPGAPDFPISSCEDYAGIDFISDPAADCAARYPTGTPARHEGGALASPGSPTVTLAESYRSGLSARHWCRFDARYLDSRCHWSGVTPSWCGAAMPSLCLKRASGTGGCDRVAETIRCRALEAAHAQRPRFVRIEDVRDAGCAPCTILPFRPVPARCRLASPPRHPLAIPAAQRRRILRVGDDFAMHSRDCRGVDDAADLAASGACRRKPVCADPPRGRIEWTSSHPTQLAVVNSPILVRLLDIPLRNASMRYLFHLTTSSSVREPIWRGTDRSPHWVDTAPGGDPRFRLFGAVDPGGRWSGPAAMAGVECRVSLDPYFRLEARELWPDAAADRAEMVRLFGAASLDWWHALPAAERARRTAARGVPPVSDPPAPGEMEARDAAMTQAAGRAGGCPPGPAGTPCGRRARGRSA